MSLFVKAHKESRENAEDGGERDIGVHVDRNPGNKYSCVKKN